MTKCRGLSVGGLSWGTKCWGTGLHYHSGRTKKSSTYFDATPKNRSPVLFRPFRVQGPGVRIQGSPSTVIVFRVGLSSRSCQAKSGLVAAMRRAYSSVTGVTMKGWRYTNCYCYATDRQPVRPVVEKLRQSFSFGRQAAEFQRILTGSAGKPVFALLSKPYIESNYVQPNRLQPRDSGLSGWRFRVTLRERPLVNSLE